MLPVIICILASLAGAGCASKNYSTTLRPYPHSFDGVQAKFRINHVDAIPPLIFYMSGFTDNEYWAEKGNRCRKDRRLSAAAPGGDRREISQPFFRHA